jgi:tripartite-type tricarboxylate transporter receptor subunit TctC
MAAVPVAGLRRRTGVLPLLCLGLAAASDSALAQTGDYPNRPIRLIVPFPVGGGVDGVARVVALRLSERVGQQVVIDNRGGSGGIIGTELAARSTPDGYTLFYAGSASHGITPNLYRKLPYDAVHDFSPVVLIGATPYLLVVHPSVPAANVKELVALARAKPGALNYSSAGNGTTLHLTAELFRSMAGISIVHIPYKGAGPALADLLSGQVQLTFNPAVVVGSHVATGKLRALGVTSAKRTLLNPELPTIAEGGVSGYEATGWYGLMGPRGLPADVVVRLHRELSAMLKEAQFMQRLAPLGVEPAGGTTAEFGAYIRAEMAKWGKVVRDSGARVD